MFLEPAQLSSLSGDASRKPMFGVEVSLCYPRSDLKQVTSIFSSGKVCSANYAHCICLKKKSTEPNRASSRGWSGRAEVLPWQERLGGQGLRLSPALCFSTHCACVLTVRCNSSLWKGCSVSGMGSWRKTQIWPPLFPSYTIYITDLRILMLLFV